MHQGYSRSSKNMMDKPVLGWNNEMQSQVLKGSVHRTPSVIPEIRRRQDDSKKVVDNLDELWRFSKRQRLNPWPRLCPPHCNTVRRCCWGCAITTSMHSHQFDPTKCQQNMLWVKVEGRKEAANSWLKNIAGQQQTALTPCCPLCRWLLISIVVIFIAEIAACSLIENKIDFPFSFSVSHMPVWEYGYSRHMLCSPHNLELVTVLAAPALIPLALLWSWCLRHWVMPRCLEQNSMFFCAQGEQDHVLCWPDCLTMLCWVMWAKPWSRKGWVETEWWCKVLKQAGLF